MRTALTRVIMRYPELHDSCQYSCENVEYWRCSRQEWSVPPSANGPRGLSPLGKRRRVEGQEWEWRQGKVGEKYDTRGSGWYLSDLATCGAGTTFYTVVSRSKS